MGYDKPAFPVPSPVSEYTDGRRMDGMSLRDYFAAAALQGLLADSQWEIPTMNKCAARAFEFADAMLRERNRGDDPDTDAK